MTAKRVFRFAAIVFVIALCTGLSLAAKPSLFYSQVGYRPDEPKYLALEETASKFQVIGVSDNKPVFEGKIVGPIEDAATGEQYWQGDFSSLTQPGIYYILVDGKTRSEKFSIAADVWAVPQRLVLRSYYLQRCGVAIKDQESKVRHAACHQRDALVAFADSFHKGGERLENKGGWHDAGDYGKYISTAGISIYTMLSAYELYPERLKADDLEIPESGNKIPDLLDEVRFEIEWMLKMQLPDGGVYHKIGGSTWPGGVAPESDPTTRYIYGVSTSATAKFAASIAYAARIYKTVDPAFADRLLAAAKLSWKFLGNSDISPDPVGPDNNGSGAYPDRSVMDDRFATAVELYLSTGDAVYQKYAQEHIPSIAHHPNWEDGSALAMFHYAKAKKDSSALKMQQLLTSAAKTLAVKTQQSVFRVTMSKEEFAWGSNRELMGDSIVLFLANELTPNPEFVKAGTTQLHYIFGLNPMGKSYVAGLGYNPVLHPHHRIYQSSGRVVPGLMADGPNSHGESGVEPKNLGAKSYVDQTEAYSCNEPAIDINANLFFVIVAANK
ncbi:MAG TPA: glycoside hydrolase family 9 protein [Bacillota bacterium]|nr:glycoside hydrolase family 9 protein [Bacillota bacterium]